MTNEQDKLPATEPVDMGEAPDAAPVLADQTPEAPILPVDPRLEELDEDYEALAIPVAVEPELPRQFEPKDVENGGE